MAVPSPIQQDFIQRWQKSSASERANYALFLSELCDYLDLPRPEPSQADESVNVYVIDKAVDYKELDGSTTTNFIDLYRQLLCPRSQAGQQSHSGSTL